MHVKNHHHHENYHNLNYPIFSFKFISFRFYIWKIKKTKSLSHVSKKGYPNCEYAMCHVQSLENDFYFGTLGSFDHVFTPIPCEFSPINLDILM